ncbi:MAG: hypothetical protein ACLVJ6_11835 [Merdibacter sp.]
MSGAMSVCDERMYRLLAMMADTEQIRLEPARWPACQAPSIVWNECGNGLFKAEGLSASADHFTHIV